MAAECQGKRRSSRSMCGFPLFGDSLRSWSNVDAGERRPNSKY
ncbi:hypothetical protein Pd630_LPD13116 (plasmid) [Rhodococcus opacus PD630]|nr:hypothetical protein Pd630_LPD13116 [Rhodococcus opacus PD630]